MTKFKVGDKIEVMDGICKGKKGFITEITVEHGVTKLWGLWDKGQLNPTYFNGASYEYRLIKGVERTMDDLKLDDILQRDGYNHKVLGRVENVVALSFRDNLDVFWGWYTIQQIKALKFTLPSETKEMTVAEVEKLVGHKVKIVKG